LEGSSSASLSSDDYVPSELEPQNLIADYKELKQRYKPKLKEVFKEEEKEQITKKLKNKFKKVNTMLCEFQNNYYNYFAYEEEMRKRNE
jgi:hypothetical protein